MKIKPIYLLYCAVFVIIAAALLTAADFYGVLMFSACFISAAAVIMKQGV